MKNSTLIGWTFTSCRPKGGHNLKVESSTLSSISEEGILHFTFLSSKYRNDYVEFFITEFLYRKFTTTEWHEIKPKISLVHPPNIFFE